MKFITATISVLATLSSLAFGAEDMVYSDHEVHFTFKIEGMENPAFSATETAFIDHCVMEAYNDITNPEVSFIYAVEVQSESATKLDDNLLSSPLKRLNAWIVNWFFQVSSGDCNFCSPDDNDCILCGRRKLLRSDEQLNAWAVGACQKITRGPFEKLMLIQDCQFEVVKGDFKTFRSMEALELPNPEDYNVEGREMHLSFEIDGNGRSSPTEENFVATTLMKAYNRVHNTDASFVESIVVELHSAEPRDDSIQLAPGADEDADSKSITEYKFDALFEVCKSCLPSNCASLDGCNAPLHSKWETEFCSGLRKGPFEVFHEVRACSIDNAKRLSVSSLVPSIETPVAKATVAEDDLPYEEFTEIVHEAIINFKVEKDRPFTKTESVFIASAIKSSYDEIHDPAIASIERVDIEEDITQEVPSGNEQHLRATTSVNLHHLRLRMHSLLCTLCEQTGKDCTNDTCFKFEPNDHEARTKFHQKNGLKNHATWEANLCKKLQASPFEILLAADDCKIKYVKSSVREA